MKNIPYFILILLLIYISCKSNNESIQNITFQIKQGDFLHVITEKGELEAKKASQIVTPNINWRMLKIARIIPEGSKVEQGDIVLKFESQEIENNYKNAIDELEIAEIEMHKREVELTLERINLESSIENTKITLETSKLKLVKLKFEPQNKQEIEKLIIKKTEVELDRNQKKLVLLKKIQQEEKNRLQLKINQAQNKLDQAKENLAKLTLKAPVNGFVIYERSWMTGEKIQEGGSVYGNMPLLKIPDLSIMQVKLMVGETDAQKIKKGQVAQVRIPSISANVFKGQVSRKDKMAKPIKRKSKIKKVEVIVEIDSQQVQIAPGITAECSIEIDKYDSVFYVPQECIFEKDSTKILYVLEDNFYKPHVVDIIHHTENFVIINSELTDNKKCALIEPQGHLIKWPDTLKAYK